MRQMAIQLAKDIRFDPAAAARLISDWEQTNIAGLQLADTMAEAAKS
jgi:hypothetical protein